MCYNDGPVVLPWSARISQRYALSKTFSYLLQLRWSTVSSRRLANAWFPKVESRRETSTLLASTIRPTRLKSVLCKKSRSSWDEASIKVLVSKFRAKDPALAIASARSRGCAVYAHAISSFSAKIISRHHLQTHSSAIHPGDPEALALLRRGGSQCTAIQEILITNSGGNERELSLQRKESQSVRNAFLPLCHSQ